MLMPLQCTRRESSTVTSSRKTSCSPRTTC
jgi:hypothetical protein